MAGLTPAHLLLILIIALVVIGPGKLPEVGAAIGKSFREFQKATGDVQSSLTSTLTAPTPPPAAPAQQFVPGQQPPAQSYYASQPVYGQPANPAQPNYPQPAYPVQPAYPAPMPQQITSEPSQVGPVPAPTDVAAGMSADTPASSRID